MSKRFPDKAVICLPLSNRICFAEVNKEKMENNPATRIDVTDSALKAVCSHLMYLDSYEEHDGWAGYDYNKTDGSVTIRLCAVDISKWDLVRKES